MGKDVRLGIDLMHITAEEIAEEGIVDCYFCGSDFLAYELQAQIAAFWDEGYGMTPYQVFGYICFECITTRTEIIVALLEKTGNPMPADDIYEAMAQIKEAYQDGQ